MNHIEMKGWDKLTSEPGSMIPDDCRERAKPANRGRSADVLRFEVGTELPNGRTILAARKNPRGNAVIVLAFQADSAHPFATWVAKPEAPETTSQGDYFTNIEEALESFKSRSA